jgi:hypothetical protein
MKKNENKFTPLGEDTPDSEVDNFNDIFGEFSDSDELESDLSNESFFSGDDIQDFVKQGIEKQNKELAYNKFSKLFGYSESSVIKKEDIDENLIITQNELETLLKLEDDDRKKTKFERIIQSDDQAVEDYLQEKFKDYIVYPKMSGNTESLPEQNLIPGELIEKSDRQVEITDDPNTIENEHRTSVEIDRDENGDIESITVFCKCGERTFIKFEFDDSEENESTMLQSQARVSSFKLEEIQIDKNNKKQ